MAVKKETERRSAERRTEPKAAPKSTPKPASFNNTARAEISADEVRKLISEAAYYRAKQRGFQPGHELDDWIQAEAEVTRRLNSPGR
jgi:hypothetical protein